MDKTKRARGIAPTKQLKAIEFDALAKVLNLTEERIKIVRPVMVEGKKMQAVGEENQITRQAVYQFVNNVWREWLKIREFMVEAENTKEK